MKMMILLLMSIPVMVTGVLCFAGEEVKLDPKKPDWVQWHRPVDQPVFSTTMGNNHDSIIFYDPKLEYPYHLIVSHEPAAAHLWRAKKFSWSSADWEWVSG